MVTDSSKFLSFYESGKVTTNIDPGSNVLRDYSPEDAEMYGKKLRYGPFKNVAPLSWTEVQIYARYNNPMPMFEAASRTITVSNWGYVAVDEKFEAVNSGATLKGEFGRIDFNPYIQAGHAVIGFESTIPRRARQVYY